MHYYFGKVKRSEMKDKTPKQIQNINQLSTMEKRWFAVYTKYKCEKYVADSLAKKQISLDDFADTLIVCRARRALQDGTFR